MADKKIPELAELTTSNDDMQFIVDDNGASKRIKNSNVKESASDVLTKIKTVDGTGSGLDADTIQSVAPENLSLNGGYF
jgi:predicted metal-dependent TIM-barrel fold hydrolase